MDGGCVEALLRLHGMPHDPNTRAATALDIASDDMVPRVDTKAKVRRGADAEWSCLMQSIAGWVRYAAHRCRGSGELLSRRLRHSSHSSEPQGHGALQGESWRVEEGAPGSRF